jgi:hypothetical protein
MKMSHTVTVTRTTTTTTTSAIILNTGYLKTWPGLLKLAQLILGIVVVGLVSYYYRDYYLGSHQIDQTPETFFLLMAVTFLIGTFTLLLSCLISISTASIISKTVYEVVYHGFAFILYLAASLTLIIEVNYKKRNYGRDYEPYFAAAVSKPKICKLRTQISIQLFSSLADTRSRPFWPLHIKYGFRNEELQRTIKSTITLIESLKKTSL